MTVAEKLGLSSDYFGHMFNHGWMIALLLAWFVTPVFLYVIALIFEKRLAPIWRNQFLSFMPGDLFLGGIIAASVALTEGMRAEDRWFQHGWWDLACLAFGVCFYFVGHIVVDGQKFSKGQPQKYTRSQLWSPSKLYHDFILFIGYGALLVRVAVPALIYGNGIVARFVLLGCVVTFVLLLAVDGSAGPRRMQKMRDASHPREGMYPIWERGSFVNNNR